MSFSGILVKFLLTVSQTPLNFVHLVMIPKVRTNPVRSPINHFRKGGKGNLIFFSQTIDTFQAGILEEEELFSILQMETVVGFDSCRINSYRHNDEEAFYSLF